MTVARRWMVVLVMGAVGMAALAVQPAANPAAAAVPCQVAWVTNWMTASVAPLDVVHGYYGDPTVVGGPPTDVAVTPDGATLVVPYDSGGVPGQGGVNVVDTATGTTTAIPLVHNPGAVALTPDGSRAYITNQGANDGFVTPIDLATNTAGTPIPVMIAGDIAITPDGSRALVGSQSSVVPIDLATDTAGAPIALAATPSTVAVTPDGATAFMTLTEHDELQPMDVATGVLGTAIAVPGGPMGLALTADGTAAYVTTFDPPTLTEVDLVTSAIASTLPLPVGTVAVQVAVSPDGQVALIVNAGSNNILPVQLPALTLGTAIANDPYWGGQPYFRVAFDPTCPAVTPATTTTTTSVGAQGGGAETPAVAPAAAPAAAATVATPVFTG